LPYGLSVTEWAELRRRVLLRDSFQCLCGHRGSDGHGKHLHIDHIVPWEWSRDNSMGNLRTLCRRHHAVIGYRRSRDPLYILDIFEFTEEVDSMIESAFGGL